LRQIEDLALPIRVSSFGYFKNSEQNVSSSKFALPAKHAFILVVHGTAEIQTPDNAFTACDRQLVYLPPSTEAKIVFSSGQNTAYYQLNLYIVSGNTMLNRLNIPPASSITLADITTLCSHVDTMLHYPTQSESYLYAINGQLFQFLAELERQLTTPHVEKERYAFITSLAKQLRENPESPLDITEEAHKCGLSKCYFITLFKQHTGLAPQQYRLRELINKACVLLQNTTMTIQEITYALGLDDPQYFSRLFRSIRGISPRDYRKRHLL
jgi:AraC-like DNA-binding protein